MDNHYNGVTSRLDEGVSHDKRLSCSWMQAGASARPLQWKIVNLLSGSFSILHKKNVPRFTVCFPAMRRLPGGGCRLCYRFLECANCRLLPFVLKKTLRREIFFHVPERVLTLRRAPIRRSNAACNHAGAAALARANHTLVRHPVNGDYVAAIHSNHRQAIGICLRRIHLIATIDVNDRHSVLPGKAKGITTGFAAFGIFRKKGERDAPLISGAGCIGNSRCKSGLRTSACDRFPRFLRTL